MKVVARCFKQPKAANFQESGSKQLSWPDAPVTPFAGRARLPSPAKKTTVLTLLAGGNEPLVPRGHVSSHDVAGAASRALKRTLSQKEITAVWRAHAIGLGELGKDGKTEARVYNFTKAHILEKARTLYDAGFPSDEIDVLVREGIVGASQTDAAHFAIATDLFNGKVIDAQAFNLNGNQTTLYKVKVYNEKTGRTREALFKPRLYGDNEGWGRSPIEYVAYALNRMIKMDLVPPVAYRRHIEVDFKHFDEGALLYFMPDAHLLKKVAEHEWGDSKELLLSDTRILDVLIQNSDRHGANFLRGKHWVDGSYKPALIDHAAGFRKDAYVTMTQNNAFLTGGVTKVRKQTFEALQHLNFQWLKNEVGEFLSDHEINGVLKRRDGIAAHFQGLIDKHGWDNVVVG